MAYVRLIRKAINISDNWDGLLHRSKHHGFETYDDSYWKKQIDFLGGKKFDGADNAIKLPAMELLDFLKLPKGTERIWSA